MRIQEELKKRDRINNWGVIIILLYYKSFSIRKWDEYRLFMKKSAVFW